MRYAVRGASYVVYTAMFKLYMLHVKKSKIDQEKAQLWDVEENPVF